MTNSPFKPVLLDLLRQAQISQNAFFQSVPTAELVESGTPDCWSAKDHVAHLTFWRQRLTLKVQAILRNAPQPEALDFEHMNPLIFAEQRARPWSAILAESDQAYADLITQTQQLTEEDLWMNDGEPFYLAYMGNCYEHTQNHLAQYLLDRHEHAQALAIYEEWARRITGVGAPETLEGYVFYNLSCFYATHDQVEKAKPALQQAFALDIALRDFALTDPDLIALRPDVAP